MAITLQGQFAGVAVVKINLGDLSPWVGETNAFLTDEYGVIIMAFDKQLEMRSMPESSLNKLTPEKLLRRYKRSQFPLVSIAAFPQVFRLGISEEPILIASSSIQPELNNQLRIYVSDTGRGISTEHLEDIFQPFNRAGARNGAIDGTGIGLTITQRLVGMMNGCVGVVRVKRGLVVASGLSCRPLKYKRMPGSPDSDCYKKRAVETALAQCSKWNGFIRR